MTRLPDATHHPSLRSWVESANAPDSDFPIQNLPFGVFARRGGGVRRVGVAIGAEVLDLGSCADRNLFEGLGAPIIRACRAESLVPLMALGRESWAALRLRVSELLRISVPAANRPMTSVLPQAEVSLGVPAEIGDYTDFPGTGSPNDCPR
jgi:fumarylacetoacetase